MCLLQAFHSRCRHYSVTPLRDNGESLRPCGIAACRRIRAKTSTDEFLCNICARRRKRWKGTGRGKGSRQKRPITEEDERCRRRLLWNRRVELEEHVAENRYLATQLAALEIAQQDIEAEQAGVPLFEELGGYPSPALSDSSSRFDFGRVYGGPLLMRHSDAWTKDVLVACVEVKKEQTERTSSAKRGPLKKRWIRLHDKLKKLDEGKGDTGAEFDWSSFVTGYNGDSHDMEQLPAVPNFDLNDSSLLDPTDFRLEQETGLHRLEPGNALDPAVIDPALELLPDIGRAFGGFDDFDFETLGESGTNPPSKRQRRS